MGLNRQETATIEGFNGQRLDGGVQIEGLNGQRLDGDAKLKGAKSAIQDLITQYNIDAEGFRTMPQEKLKELAKYMETLFNTGKGSIVELTYGLHGENTISANMKYGSNWKVMNLATLETRDEPKVAPRLMH